MNMFPTKFDTILLFFSWKVMYIEINAGKKNKITTNTGIIRPLGENILANIGSPHGIERNKSIKNTKKSINETR